MFQEINKILNNSAERLQTHLSGMPRPSGAEMKTNPFKGFEYKTKVFLIAEDTSASEFAEFMTNILHNPNRFHIIREKESWTQNGECIRVVDYLEKTIGEEET